MQRLIDNVYTSHFWIMVFCSDLEIQKKFYMPKLIRSEYTGHKQMATIIRPFGGVYLFKKTHKSEKHIHILYGSNMVFAIQQHLQDQTMVNTQLSANSAKHWKRMIFTENHQPVAIQGRQQRIRTIHILPWCRIICSQLAIIIHKAISIHKSTTPRIPTTSTCSMVHPTRIR